MMRSPFDHNRDEALGRLLREQLTGPQPQAYLQRLRASVAAADRPGQWDVLSDWARPRMIVAAIAAGLLLWLGAWFSDRSSLSEGVMVAWTLPAHTVINQDPPRADEIMGALLDAPAR